MFNAHAVAIRTAAINSPEVTARVLIFAILTANAPLRHAVAASRWVRDNMPLTTYASLTDADKSIMGAAMNTVKYNAVKYVWDNREAIYQEFNEKSAVEFWNYCIDYIPGLGMVKASFSVQMLYNEMGCIDTHNLKALGLPPKSLGGKSKVRRSLYLELQATKSSAAWWTDWCDFMAVKYSKYYRNGNEVSESHVAAVL